MLLPPPLEPVAFLSACRSVIPLGLVNVGRGGGALLSSSEDDDDDDDDNECREAELESVGEVDGEESPDGWKARFGWDGAAERAPSARSASEKRDPAYGSSSWLLRRTTAGTGALWTTCERVR